MSDLRLGSVPTVWSSIRSYPRATLVLLVASGANVIIGNARTNDLTPLQLGFMLLASTTMLLAAKLVMLFIFRLHKNGGVKSGDGKHAAAIITMIIAACVLAFLPLAAT